MTIKEAMESRHTVRKYTSRSIPEELIRLLMERIDEHNGKYDLHMMLYAQTLRLNTWWVGGNL